MKKIFLIPAFVALFGTAVFASDGGKKDNGTTVSYTVSNKFESTFADAQNVTWSKTKDFQKADFYINGVKMAAFYNNDSEFVGVTQQADYKAIPFKAQKEIAEKYKGYTVSGVIILQSNTDIREDIDPTAYFVDLKNDKSEILVRVTQAATTEFFQQVK